MATKGQVFVSYSHRDREWLDKLLPFLRPLEREAKLQVWSDTDLQPSSDWRAEIQKALNEADAAIVLISQDFLASDFIASNELPQLLSAASERGLRIFPVIVSSFYIRDSPLLKIQAINPPTSPLDTLDRGQQNAILAKLAASIDDLLKITLTGVTEDWLEKFRSRFVPVAGGAFVIGDNDLFQQQHALAEHEVHVDSFRLGQYVITQSEWIALMKTQPWLNQTNVKYGADNPAVYISWYDALGFIRVVNKTDPEFGYRLPNEAEWEYAARGGLEGTRGGRSKFSFGDDASKLIDYGWFDQNAYDRYAHPVGGLRENQLKLFDMHGNVWEWTSENHGGLKVARGGGFNFMAIGASSAFRVFQKPELKGEALGFRLVQEPR
jgi:formylglycine-generating enzyme required for sulfatase activity